MTRPTIDEYYMTIALAAASRASCPKRKVGAVIVDYNKRVLSIGYNGPPRDLPSCFDVPCGGETPDHPCVAAHAEINAITSCRDLQSAETIYISCSPCVSCTQAVMSTSIKRIVFGEWHKSWPLSKSIWTGEVTFMEGYDEAGYTY